MVLPRLALAASLLMAAPSAMADDPIPAAMAGKISAALPESPFAKPAKPRKLLIFSLTRGFHHASIATGQWAFTEMGRKTGAFETVVSNDLAHFEAAKIHDFDAICFLSTTGEVFSPPKQELEKMDAAAKQRALETRDRLQKNLLDYVSSGGGFVGIHAATDTLYECPDYACMINGWFDGHPWTANTRVSIKVEPGRESHPLTAMFGGRNLEFQEEIYQLKSPYDSRKVDMLLRLDPTRSPMNLPAIKRTDGDFGVSWARHWQKGRVFYCSLGHNHEIYWHPEVLRHYLAGIQWSLGDFQVSLDH